MRDSGGVGFARKRVLLLVVLSAVLAVAACTANPPPPIRSTKTTTTPAPPPPATTTVTVAIDGVGRGFNPHLRADLSPTDEAVASLVLPSAFRPVVDPGRQGQTQWLPDKTVLVSAAVTSQAPFTVTYQLRTDAQWSDGAPIAAEDFRYLWQQMISQPGVVDPAGYAQITDVRASGEGGKTVSVVFARPYPAWRQLFSNLLPAHLVKDSPGGFTTGLKDTISVSGSRFRVKYVDRGRDEILLVRNDRFWGPRVEPDQILLRRGGTSNDLADSMRADDVQVADVHGDDAALSQLATIPGVHVTRRAQGRVLQLAVNSRVPELADAQVRKGILGLLDVNLLGQVGAGSKSGALAARAQVLAPSDPGYESTMPARPSREEALALLAGAGYTDSEGRLSKEGKPLRFVIGVPAGDGRAIAVAGTTADMLKSAGIDASVWVGDPVDLYGQRLTSGAVDAVIGWVAAGGDAATELASRFGCPAAAPGPSPAAPTPSASSAPAAPPSTRAATPPASATNAPTSPSPAPTSTTPGPLPVPMPPSNLSGVCDPSLQPQIDAALAGETPMSELLPEIEPQLWDLDAVLPIMQDTTVAATGPTVAGVDLDAPVATGLFADASSWTRVAR